MAILTEFISYLRGVLMQAWSLIINVVMPKSCDNHWHWFEITNNNEIVESTHDTIFDALQGHV